MEITVGNLVKLYGAQRAVNDISFQLKSGEVLGFLGPNGAGKSTTMKMITGYLAPNSGDVKVNGKSIFDDLEGYKSQIGYLPENNPLYTDMYIVDFLSWAAQMQGVAKSAVSDRINTMIGYCGLEREKYKKIGELSKGYRQRVGLAQAMIHDPEVLIMDEPTTGLDPNQIVEIRDLIKNLGQKKTILLSTHILSEVEATCDRIIIINQGNIVADSVASLLKQKLQGREILFVQIEAPVDVTIVAQEISGIDTVENTRVIDTNGRLQIESKADASSRKAIYNKCVQKGWYLTEMKIEETRLEDVFRKLTN